MLKHLILSLPVVKKEIERILSFSDEEKNKFRSKIEKEKIEFTTSHIIMDTKIIAIKKGKIKYKLLLVKTKHGKFRIHLGRHPESGIGLGEHAPSNQPVNI